MKELLMDPMILGAGGVILVGLILLVWAIGKLRGPSSAKKPAAEFEFTLPRSGQPPLSVVSPDANPFSVNVPPPVPTPPPAVNRDVLAKVDLISQRLVDMQMLLNKQLSTPSVVPGATPAPQGLSQETLDKLIKITGNVVQQVESLQKSVGGPAEIPLDAPSAGEPPKPGAL